MYWRTEGFLLFTLMALLPAYLVPLTWLFVGLETFTGLQRFYEAYRISPGQINDDSREGTLEELSLAAAGVAYNQRSILVDATLRTTAHNIWAAGDTAGPYLFTHVANYQGRLVVGNALFPVSRKVDYQVVPWTTFLDPEIAHLGLTECEARERHGVTLAEGVQRTADLYWRERLFGPTSSTGQWLKRAVRLFN